MDTTQIKDEVTSTATITEVKTQVPKPRMRPKKRSSIQGDYSAKQMRLVGETIREYLMEPMKEAMVFCLAVITTAAFFGIGTFVLTMYVGMSLTNDLTFIIMISALFGLLTLLYVCYDTTRSNKKNL